jgi:hypothetical protein
VTRLPKESAFSVGLTHVAAEKRVIAKRELVAGAHGGGSMRLVKSFEFALPAVLLLAACSSTKVEKEPATPVTAVETHPSAIPAPPPGGKTEVKTEDAEGHERKVEIKTKEDD